MKKLYIENLLILNLPVNLILSFLVSTEKGVIKLKYT